jgi:hypothetical protein
MNRARKGDLLERARKEGRPLTVAEFKQITKPKAISEHVTQSRLVAWVREIMAAYDHPYSLPLHNFFAIPNQAGRDIDGTGMGAKIRQAKMVREGLAPGYPDTGLDVARAGYYGLRLEIKKEADWNARLVQPYASGEPSAEQTEWHRRLADEGYLVGISWGWEPARDAIVWYLQQQGTGPYLARHGPVITVLPIVPRPVTQLRWVTP